MNNKKFLRLLFLSLVIATFITIFNFSSEEGKQSNYTSEKVVKKIVDTFPNTQKSNPTEKEKQMKGLKIVVRKMAHFLIYTSVGIWMMCFISTYNITVVKKLFFTIGIGILYAISDEIHQGFIPGRSPEIRDILIDTCGVILGSFIIMVIIHFLGKRTHRDYEKAKVK